MRRDATLSEKSSIPFLERNQRISKNTTPSKEALSQKKKSTLEGKALGRRGRSNKVKVGPL